MLTRTVSEVRDQFADSLELAQKEPITVLRRGSPKVVLLSAERYEKLVADADELADIAAFDDAVNETGENISWAQALSDLGWT